VVQALLLHEWGVQGGRLPQDDLLVRRSQGRGRRRLLLWCDGAAVGDAGGPCCRPGTQCQNNIQGQVDGKEYLIFLGLLFHTIY